MTIRQVPSGCRRETTVPSPFISTRSPPGSVPTSLQRAWVSARPSFSSVVVTHGGHGTVMKALAAGVPLVVLPMGRDQLEVAARVVAAGAGVRLKPSAAPAKVAAAVRTLLDDEKYRKSAQRLAAAIAEETAVDRALAELEDLASPRHRAIPMTA
jgi:UDP:flavonoid glycosyltransferase YjiC (YdhE family)